MTKKIIEALISNWRKNGADIEGYAAGKDLHWAGDELEAIGVQVGVVEGQKIVREAARQMLHILVSTAGQY